MKELMTKRELAALLKVSTRTIDRFRSQLRVQGLHLGETRVGRQVRFDPEQAEKMLPKVAESKPFRCKGL